VTDIHTIKFGSIYCSNVTDSKIHKSLHVSWADLYRRKRLQKQETNY